MVFEHHKINSFDGSHSSAPLRSPFVGLLLVLLALFLGKPDRAWADFRLCNDTSSLVGVALGYRQNGEWISEGWWQVPSQTCTSLLEGDLNSRFYYLYAEDADLGGRWTGKVQMCTDSKKFLIKGVKDCFPRGYQKNGFYEVDTGNNKNWMARLTQSKTIESNK